MVYADNQKLIGIYRRSLVVGAKVRFDLEQGQVGCQTTNIVVLNVGFD